jgi:dihydroorotate dehydrogenase
MYPFIRSLLFRLEPERAHAMTVSLLRLVGAAPPLVALLRSWYKSPPKPVNAFGLSFVNPVGLAAGYDKDGLGWRGLACLGFGHIEVGTVTPQPQEGNARPRIFRLPEDRALINRMGFPGRGADFLVKQISRSRPANLVLGVNIGKNEATPIEEAHQDYVFLFRKFAPLADYLALNVSSPNTVGLRSLQARQNLDDLLRALGVERRSMEADTGKEIPVLVKLAPDLTEDELDDALQVILDNNMDGVIVTNTTIGREGLSSQLANESGGLSGAPLTRLSTRMVRQVYQKTVGRLPIIGVGGIESASGAQEKLDAGATLVQIYTGLIYEGPGLVKRILKQLS